jgi:chemotaxis response regulator CheB
VLRDFIEANGWEVCGEAEDGLAAVEKAASLKPDLVILGL